MEEIKTIHGCTCKNEWSFTPGGKKYKGCIMGGPDNALCPTTYKKGNLKKSCLGSKAARPYCVVNEKECGYYTYKESGIPGVGTDWCDWSSYTFGNTQRRPAFVLHQNKFYGGLILYIILYYLGGIYIFNKFNYSSGLVTWLPNPSLFAATLSWTSSLPYLDIFKYLSNKPTTTAVGAFSNKTLQICGLLGLAFVALRRKNTKQSIIFICVMLLFSHAIGPPLILRICAFIYYKILARHDTDANDPNITRFSRKIQLLLTSIFGFIIAMFLIYIENLIIRYLEGNKYIQKRLSALVGKYILF